LPRKPILVLTQLPDQSSAEALAKALIETRLAACVTIGALSNSIYHWHGKTETAQELPVIVKTCDDHYSAVEAAIRARHPYELPEVVAVPIVHGLAPYLDWIAAETQPLPLTSA
jgi:periplasmic divalent cation tolerance protein